MIKYKYKNESGNFVNLIGNSITLPNAFSNVMEIQIWVTYEDTDNDDNLQLTNGIDLSANNEPWIETKRNYFTDEELKAKYNESSNRPTIILYIKENNTRYERNSYYMVTNNITGDFEVLTISQPPCNFEITTSIGTTLAVDSGVPKTFTANAYGCSKNFSIYATPYTNNDNRPLDLNELKISKKLIQENEKYNVYEIEILFFGSVTFETPEDAYHYNLNLVHNDNVESVTTITVSPIFIVSPTAISLLTMFNDESSLQINNCVTKYDRNLNNLKNAKFETVENTTEGNVNTISLFNSELLKLNNMALFRAKTKSPINLIDINDNEITIKTLNLYNENDSALNIKSSSIWCRTEDHFDGELHKVVIHCLKNKYYCTRKCRVSINNAEAQFGTLEFTVTQDGKGNISIEQV